MTAPSLMTDQGNSVPNPQPNGPGHEHERLSHMLNREPDFHAFYQTFNRRALTLCLIAIPVGIVMKLPVVWGLAMLGVAVTVYRLYFTHAKKD